MSSPPHGGSPTPLRERWWGWCCFHWQLQPMLGTWWQQCSNRDMGSGCSNLECDIKRRKKAFVVHPEETIQPQNRPRILQVGRRRRGSPTWIIVHDENAQNWVCPPCIVWRCCENWCKGCMWCYRKWQRRQSAALPVGSVHGSRWSCEAGQRRQAGGTCEQPPHHNNVA